MRLTEAINHLGLALPTSEQAVKTAYRRLAHIHHPDKGGNPDKFQLIKDARESLTTEHKPHLTEVNTEDATTDGTPLSDLGKGIGFNKNACICNTCNGKGFKSKPSGGFTYIPCKKCDGSGYITSLPCNRCGGDGKHKDAKTGRIKGDCWKCNGTGRYKLKGPSRCRECNKPPPRRMTMFDGIFGASDSRPGFVKKASSEIHHKCHSCKGTGETELWNPVIPKGRL
jgi:DnaJ-class molecular chaperone